jgi:hypothetical protein
MLNKSKELNDEAFYENLEDLNFNRLKPFDVISNTHSDSLGSVRDDFFINKDVLNLINSPTVIYI